MWQIFRMDDVYYFHDLIKQLTDWGYQEGTTLFGFGYDFRQSNRLAEHMDKFKAKLESMHKASGGKKADIISHSMGGVFVKCFLALHHDVTYELLFHHEVFIFDSEAFPCCLCSLVLCLGISVDRNQSANVIKNPCGSSLSSM